MKDDILVLVVESGGQSICDLSHTNSPGRRFQFSQDRGVKSEEVVLAKNRFFVFELADCLSSLIRIPRFAYLFRILFRKI